MPQFPRKPFVRVCLASATAALLLSGCSALGLGGGDSESKTGSNEGFTVPSGMTMPTPLPTAQPTTLPDIKIGMPKVTGYQQVPRPTDAPTAMASMSPGTEVTTRTWASADPLCTIQVDITRSTSLLLAGGDDRHLSAAWNEGLQKKLQSYQETASESRVVDNSNNPFTGISTDFTATIQDTKVVGRSFVRVFSKSGTQVSVTHTCSAEKIDQDAWNQVLGGLTISPADDTSWPGATTAATPTATPSRSFYTPTPAAP